MSGIEDAEIIALVHQAAVDSDAFELLFKRYRPLVNALVHHYHLTTFDQDDWLQEARTGLFRAIQHYDGHTGSMFGSYYNLVLESQFNGLLREQLAFKRRADQQALIVTSPKIKNRPNESPRVVEDSLLMGIELQELLASYSDIELRSLLAEYHGTLAEESVSVRRARERTRRKLEQFIADYHR